ncbi:histone deacetylase, partial [Pseudomonas syringae pv. tagetis]
KNFASCKAQCYWVIALSLGIGVDDYLNVVDDLLNNLLPFYKPDLVLYDAREEVHKDDALGNLKHTDQELANRDEALL